MNRPIICAFLWYGDVTSILRNKHLLPRGVYASEDLPEIWNDRRRVLKPLYNAAKKKEDLKLSTFLMKDKLVIKGKTYTIDNFADASSVLNLNLNETCQQSNSQTIVFQGIHSIFSNLHPTSFRIDNVDYCSVEQYFQAEKAKSFDDDKTHYKIMCERNSYRIKKLGSKVKGYKEEHWKTLRSGVMLKGMRAKFTQNEVLKKILLNTGTAKIAEATTDQVWGNGLRLFDKNVMNIQYWKRDGLMSELYSKLRSELST